MKNKLITILCFISVSSFLCVADTIKETPNFTTKIDSIDSETNRNFVTVENILPSESPNYFSEVIPIITLILGFFIAKIYDYWQHRKSMKSEGKQWIETFIQLKDPLEKQTQSISEFLDENPPDVYRIDNPQFQMALDCVEFESLKKESIVPYLQVKGMKYSESVKYAGKIKNTVRMIESTSKMLNEAVSELRNNSSIHHGAFSKELPKFRMHIANYIEETLHSDSASETQSNLANKIVELANQHINKHLNTGTLNVFKLSKDFIPQFLDVTYDDYKHPELISATESISKCDQAIKNLIMERVYLRNKLKHCQDSYKNCLSQITNIEEKL